MLKSSMLLEGIYFVISMLSVLEFASQGQKYCKLKTMQPILKVDNKSVPVVVCAREWDGMHVD